MKKLLAVSVVYMACFAGLYAQDAKPANSSNAISGRMGAYASYNFSTITGSDSWAWGYSGFSVGLMYRVAELSSLASIWVEPGYSLIGSKWEEDFGGGQNYSGTVALGYIPVPVIVRFQAQNGLFGDVGLQPQFLVSAKEKYDGDSEDVKEFVNTFDFGIPVGVGYEFNRRFGVSLRYYLGLTNINKDGDESDKNSVFSLRAHVRF